MTITYETITCQLARQDTAVMRARLPVAALSGWLPAAYGSVAEYLQRRGVEVTGPPFARYDDLEREQMSVEAGFPVLTAVPAGDGVEPSFLPAGPAVITTHMGRYEELGGAFEATRRWVHEHGYHPAGPHWEIYFTDPEAEPDPARWHTEVVLPFRPSRP